MNGSLIDNVLRQYGLRYSDFHRSANAAISNVFIVDNRYVVRSRTLEPGIRKKFAVELERLETVRKHVSLHLPIPIAAGNGERFVIQENQLWTVYAYIPGQVICTWNEFEKATPRQTRALMRALGKWHSQTRGLLDLTDESRYQFVNEMKLILKKLSGIISHKEADRGNTALQRIEKAAGQWEAADTVFVHGDFHHGNLILDDEDDPVGLLDFDWSWIGPAVADVSYTVMMLLRRYDTERFQFPKQTVLQLLDWYGLPEKSFLSFTDYLILYNLHDIHIFRSTPMPKQQYYLAYQQSMSQELCRIFEKKPLGM
jgi:aminoglycoside phosphotransferase (APT) family kinase protein